MNNLKKKNAKTLVIIALLLAFSVITAPCFAAPNDVDVGAGLNKVDANTLATKILQVGIGIGALGGSLATARLIFLGLKLIKSDKERDREATIDSIKNVFIGLGISALAVLICGFAVFVLKGA